MNPALTELLPAARIAAASPKLRVTILYECLDTGKHAKHLTDQLAAELADVESANRALDLNLWSFGVLGLREVRNDSVGTAATADLVILSMSGKNPLPTQVEAWIEMWTWLIDGHKPAVVGSLRRTGFQGRSHPELPAEGGGQQGAEILSAHDLRRSGPVPPRGDSD